MVERQQQRFNEKAVYGERCPIVQDVNIPKADWVPGNERQNRAQQIEEETVHALLGQMQAVGSIGNIAEARQALFHIDGVETTAVAGKQSPTEVVYKERMQCDPTLELQLAKRYHVNSTRNDGLCIDILRPGNAHSNVANFNIEMEPDGTLNILHRWVDPAYRGNDIFPAILRSLKLFVDTISAAQQSSVRMRFEAGQPKLLAIVQALGLGYVPENDDHANRIDKMLSGDPSLFLDHAHYPEEHTQLLRQQKGRMLYCYEGDRLAYPVQMRTQQDAYRASLMYVSDPQTIGQMQSETGQHVQSSLNNH